MEKDEDKARELYGYALIEKSTETLLSFGKTKKEAYAALGKVDGVEVSEYTCTNRWFESVKSGDNNDIMTVNHLGHLDCLHKLIHDICVCESGWDNTAYLQTNYICRRCLNMPN